MKTKIYIALTALLAGFVFNSCTSDEMEADKGSESLVLSVSSEIVELDQLMSDRKLFILLGLLVVTMEQIPVSAMFLKWI